MLHVLFHPTRRRWPLTRSQHLTYLIRLIQLVLPLLRPLWVFLAMVEPSRSTNKVLKSMDSAEERNTGWKVTHLLAPVSTVRV